MTAAVPASGGAPAAAPGRGGRRTGARRRSAARRGVPLLVLLAVAAQLVLGLAWTVLEPPYDGLDEPNHVAGVVQLLHHDTWPAPEHLITGAGVLATYRIVVKSEQGTRFLAPTEPRGQRPSLDALGGDTPTGAHSQMSQHPPLYYALDALVVRAVPGEHTRAWDRELWIMRMVGVVLVAPLPLLAWAAMRRLTRSVGLQSAAALSPLLLPSLSRIAGSVSNDSLLVLTMSLVALGVARIATGDATRRTAALTGVAAMLALLTKGTALVTPAWLALAYLWCWRGGRRKVLAPVLTAAVPVALGLVWWVANIVRFGAVQPAGQPNAPGLPGHGTRVFVENFLSAVSYRFWSALGNPEPPGLDRSLIQVASWVTLALVVVGVVGSAGWWGRGLRPRTRSRSDAAAGETAAVDTSAVDPAAADPAAANTAVAPAADASGPGATTAAVPAVAEGARVARPERRGVAVAALVLLFGPVAVLAVIAEGSLATFHQNGMYTGVQGRYLYPTIVPLAVVALLGLGVILRGRLAALAPLVVAVFAGLLQVDSLLDLVRATWDPVGGGLRDGAHRLLQWSPWSTRVTESGFALVAIVAVALALAVLLSTVTGLRATELRATELGGSGRRAAA